MLEVRDRAVPHRGTDRRRATRLPMVKLVGSFILCDLDKLELDASLLWMFAPSFRLLDRAHLD